MHVDWQDLTGSSQMIDEYNKLHPAFPFISLITTQCRRLTHTLLVATLAVLVLPVVVIVVVVVVAVVVVVR